MKYTVKLLFFATLLFFIAVDGHAQNGQSIPPPEERAKKITEWMKANLQLTDEQVTQVQPINVKYANKAQELQGSTSPKKQKLLALKDIDSAKDEELKKVLSGDQFKTYQSKKNELKKQMKEKMKEKKAG